MKADCRDDWKDSDPAAFCPLADGARRPCSNTRKGMGHRGMENLPATSHPEKRRGLVHASLWPLLIYRTRSRLDTRKIKQLISWLSSTPH